jgi:hypothetical protein
VIFAGSPDEISFDSAVGCDVAPKFRKLVPTTCTQPFTPPAGCQAFDEGDLFDATQFPALASDMVGSGRVRLVVSHPIDDERGLVVNPASFAAVVGRYARGPFFDTERQLPCTDEPLADGTIRCLTADVITTDGSFADAACSVPNVQLFAVDGSCPTLASGIAPKFAFSPETGGVYSLGSVIERTTIYYREATDPPVCMKIPLASGLMYYDLTPADPSLFATLTQAHD